MSGSHNTCFWLGVTPDCPLIPTPTVSPAHVSHIFPENLTPCPFLFTLEDISSCVRILITPLVPRQAYAFQTRSIMNQAVKDAILDGPALAPPPGVKPNFVNPSNLAHPELAVLQLAIATFVVVMRIYTKLGVLRKMQAEDCEYSFYGPQTESGGGLTRDRLAGISISCLCRLPCHCFHSRSHANGRSSVEYDCSESD